MVQEMFVIRSFHFLVVLVLLLTDNTIVSFPFLLHHREALSTSLLNSLKKRAKGRKRSASLRTEEVVGAAWKAINEKSKKKFAC
jgi:hypothetical protein